MDTSRTISTQRRQPGRNIIILYTIRILMSSCSVTRRARRAPETSSYSYAIIKKKKNLHEIMIAQFGNSIRYYLERLR